MQFINMHDTDSTRSQQITGMKVISFCSFHTKIASHWHLLFVHKVKDSRIISFKLTKDTKKARINVKAANIHQTAF